MAEKVEGEKALGECVRVCVLALVWRNDQKGQMQMGAPRRARGELKGVEGWWSWGLGTSHTKGKSEREEEGKEGSTSGTTKQMHERVIQYNTRWWTSGIRGMDRRPHNVEDPWNGRPCPKHGAKREQSRRLGSRQSTEYS